MLCEAQEDAFSQEVAALRKGKHLPKNSHILALNRKIDEEGLMRSNSRIINASILAFQTRCPIILPRRHKVTELIIKHHHEKMFHAGGTNHVLAKLSAEFWIVAAREQIRRWENKCAECKRRRGKQATQIMAPLPDVRLGVSLQAFDKVGCDYAGPFLTKQGRGKVRTKRYLCLFTCLVTRAVHLEMAYSLDTDSLLNALWRMAARRGLPSMILSDNGKNMVGAEAELKALLGKINMGKMQAETAHTGVTWKFNPPYEPHFGSVYEIMIREAKRAIYAQLKNAEVSDEELSTIIIGAEGLINSRPITYQSANPRDLTPLTPNHFLYGRMGGELAPEIDASDLTPVRRWRRIQEVIKNFWKRWMEEWLPSLAGRRKWQHKQRYIKVGDVVLVIVVDTERG